MTIKNYDYSKLFSLLDEQKIKEIGQELASQVLSNTPIEYEDCYVNIQIPSTVIRLLKTLTDILPLELEDILSKMATTGINNILQEVTKSSEKEMKTNPLDDIEPLNKISEQFSELQEVINRFSNMTKVIEDIQDGTGNNLQTKDEKTTK